MIKIKKVKLETPVKIYDINVDNNHNFFANNILVHNCVESFSVTHSGNNWKMEMVDGEVTTTETDSLYHSCNLISINVGIIHDDKTLERVCRAAVRMLDASIETGTMPVLEAQKSAEWLRNVGIGNVGVADWMAWNKFSYETDLDELEKLQEKIAWYCYNASVDLAIEKGAYPAFKPENYDNGLFGKSSNELVALSKNGFAWGALIKRIQENGIRNFLLLAIAPNTSSGIVCNATASWLPPQNKLSYQTLADINTPIIPRYLAKRYWHYKGKFNYAAEDMLKVVRVLQKWVDTGISSEIYINPELTDIKKISDEILDGFDKKELKAVYYSLTIDAKEREACTDCSN